MFNETNMEIFALGALSNQVQGREVYIEYELGNKSVVALRYQGNIIIITNKNMKVRDEVIEKARACLNANSTLLMAIL